MYRIKEIQEKLLHLVGWRQDYEPSKRISEEMTQSESGLLFQQAHPLLTLENIRNVMPEEYFFKYENWNNEKEYAKGDKVKKSGVVYICEVANVNKTPEENPTYWEHFNFLSDYLQDEVIAGITQTIQRFITEKQLSKETTNLLEHKCLFDGSANKNALVENRSRLVGFEIVPLRSMGVTTKIEKIGLQMRGGVGTIKMYLFHSSQSEPIKTFELDFTNSNGFFQWFNLEECFLPYIGANDAGGSWYLCYNQNELPVGVEALNVSKDWSREPCGTCNIGSVEVWREMTKYIQISPFCVSVDETFTENPTMFDISKINYTNCSNYGINCEISIGCDLTDFIVSQRLIFQNVVQKQVAYNLLRTMAMNPDVRVNRNQSNVSRMDILYELDGNTQGIRGGLGYELEKDYKALNLDTKGLDRICLTCHNGGIRFRSF